MKKTVLKSLVGNEHIFFTENGEKVIGKVASGMVAKLRNLRLIFVVVELPQDARSQSIMSGKEVAVITQKVLIDRKNRDIYYEDIMLPTSAAAILLAMLANSLNRDFVNAVIDKLD